MVDRNPSSSDDPLRALAREMGLPEDDPKVLDDLRTLKQGRGDPEAGKPIMAEQEAPPTGRQAPGWYPNPSAPGQRYWDGHDWTGRYADYKGNVLDVPPPPVQEKADLTVQGYLAAFLIPIVGFVIGIILLARRNDQGAGVLVISVLASVFWTAILLY